MCVKRKILSSNIVSIALLLIIYITQTSCIRTNQAIVSDIKEQIGLCLTSSIVKQALNVTSSEYVRIEVDKGVVTLSGSVDLYHNYDCIESFAKTVNGVTNVVNKLTVSNAVKLAGNICKFQEAEIMFEVPPGWRIDKEEAGHPSRFRDDEDISLNVSSPTDEQGLRYAELEAKFKISNKLFTDESFIAFRQELLKDMKDVKVLKEKEKVTVSVGGMEVITEFGSGVLSSRDTPLRWGVAMIKGKKLITVSYEYHDYTRKQNPENFVESFENLIKSVRKLR